LRPATVLISVESTARDIQDLDSLAVVGFRGERQNKKQDVAAISGREFIIMMRLSERSLCETHSNTDPDITLVN
jgi:hypothetical protein